MAVAETADLAVRLSLNDKQFSSTLNRIDRRLGAFSGAVNRNLGRAFDAALYRGARVLTGAFTGGVEALRELEVVTTQTNAVIKSTGGIAGVTAEEVRNLSEKYESLNATIDDKVIQSAQNTLLTFTNLREEAFEPALEAVLDYATATGTDAVAASKMLGRALNDPISGLGRLARAGIQLDEATEKRIKKLQEEGDLLGAQQVLLDEVAKRYGGSFAANADTAAAKQAKLADAVEDLQKAFAGPLLPIVTKVGERLAAYASKPETIAFFDKLGSTIAELFTDENLDTAAFAIETAASAVGTAIKAFNSLPPEIKALAIGALTLNKVTGGAVGGAAEAFGKIIGGGLKQIFAAHVTVVGKSVTGGPGGVPAGGGGVAGKLGSALSIAAIAASIAAPIITAIEISDQSSTQADGLQNQLLKDISTKTPEDLDTALKGVEQGIRDLESNPLSVLVRGDALDVLKDMRDQIRGEQERDSLIDFRAGERDSAGGSQPFAQSMKGLQERLADAIRQEERATRNGNDRNARIAANKVDRLSNRISAGLNKVDNTTDATAGQLRERLERVSERQVRAEKRGDDQLARELGQKVERMKERLAEATNRVNGKLGTANSKLSTIARKDLSVKVNVSSAVSVATYVRGVATSVRYGDNRSVTAT